MSELNQRQQAFADEYIITGNAYQSAIRAGYTENYAKNAKEKLVDKGGSVSEYIKEKLKQIQTEKHLTMEEALAITSSIARGEPQIYVSRELDPETQEVLSEELHQHSASSKERNQALEHFYKINGVFTEKRDVDLKNTDINIVIGDKDDD
ncbi:terminase small subunit [Vagococcus sp. CY52-2]|uniref:terminase small subunit n=1 Tax=Vagococcus sp. CY52-2 TaxID=2925838 RepID=UPI001F5949C1|nr:terminase small subunit [Vagococcus sp. CY52-2]UNM90568.1 terminase small subunit [Vagococcus sp. CY52-2]